MMDDTQKIRLWLYTCCFMVLAMAVIGAITRLTESGLSITEWRPLTGALPPLSEAEWRRVYDLYRQSPEYAQKHYWMELADFKQIFFWEWLHRLWGRLIGLVYALPLLWFALRRKIPQGCGLKFAGIFLLGGLQGFIGWWMVTSGLVDRPDVSHFRLAAHLGLALLIFGALWWVALDLENRRAAFRPHRLHGVICLLLLGITIIWGAFVAGLDAGKIYNSFPLMDGGFTPSASLAADNFLHDHGWVQFTHRWLAMATGVIILSLALRLRYLPLAAMVVVQVVLGISTLLTGAWIVLAALHQAGAIVLLALLLKALHGMKPDRQAGA